MWCASLFLLKYIVPPHPALVKTLEKFWKCILNFVAPIIWWNIFVCGPLWTSTAQVLYLFCVVRGTQIYKNWTRSGGDNWGWCYKNWQYHSFLSYNACEAITENWSDWLDELELIKKNGYRIRTKGGHNYWWMLLLLHTPSIYCWNKNVDLFGGWRCY